ncbi:hypothetical protein DCE79_08550 [Lysinibacillus sp. 2017]|uniref:YusW family protein n=1 Tax=unclassified Lysinibacillus TaxID=2636778 RepID=UPI000D525FD4|nr:MULTISPECIES: YusW family protein [unclassified Lysinibacillus]AWE07417.1 hypothetical protein DCE79_08550 [Lysinibacillus sp. 2017]TGN36581.1 hypothetical protein E4L99_03265 [Lysinibacillus sp. S2017]
MKKTALFLAISASVFLVACGDKEDATNVPDNAPVEGSNTTNNNVDNTTSNADAAFNFTHFDLDVTYANNKSYEVSYENETTGAEVKIEDDINNKKETGNQAVDTLAPIFGSFTFDATTANDDVINEVLQKFNLANDYKEFELEIKFPDGTEKEYKKVQ